MNSKDLTACASRELFDQALTNARVDPVLQSDDYWTYIGALNNQGQKRGQGAEKGTFWI
jgi:hypothetical protein